MTLLASLHPGLTVAAPAYRAFGGLRFVLAGMVLAQHGLLLLPEAAREIFYRMELGAVAVTVFFVLSGYVVAEAIGRFYAGRPAAFLANRLLRIVPLYVLALTLTIALDCWFYARGHLVPLDVALQGSPAAPRVMLAGLLDIVSGLPSRRLSGQEFSFIPFAWTLRVEMAFYLAACLACRLPQRWLMPGTAGVAYGLFALFVWRHTKLPQQFLCVPFFALGICLYRTCKQASPAAIAHLVALSACAELAFTYWGQRGHPYFGFQLPLLGLLLGALFCLAGRHPASPRLMAWDKRMGGLSYPLYIGHGVILTALRNLTDQRGWWLYAAGMGASVVLAVGLNAAIERPLCRFRERVRGEAV